MDKILDKIYEQFTFKPVLKHKGKYDEATKQQINPKGLMNVTQWFGGNSLSYYKEAGMLGHDAIDFEADTGHTAYAAIDGKVSRVQHNIAQNTREGEFIEIDSDPFTIDNTEYFLRLMYYHLDRSLVEVNTRVTAGQEVCKTDNTGEITTGPHLHFGVKPYKKVSGVWVKAFPNNGYNGGIDPYPFFKTRDFYNKPDSNEFIYANTLITNKGNPRYYFVDDMKIVFWIKDMETYTEGLKKGRWGTFNSAKVLRGKITEDFILSKNI